MISQSRFGYLFYLLIAVLIFLIVITYHKEIKHKETRASGYLEGKTYSVNGEITRVWEVKDTLIPGYPTGQVFIPTVLRITENQKQGKCASPTSPCK